MRSNALGCKQRIPHPASRKLPDNAAECLNNALIATMTNYSQLKEHCKSSSLKRKTPIKREQKRILDLQQNKCFYCGMTFGEWYICREAVPVVCVWDHFIPHSYGFNNSSDNFVASCVQCNAIKSNKIFPSVNDLVDYVRQQRKIRRLPVRTVWGDKTTRQSLAEVLFAEVSDRLILGDAPHDKASAQRVLDDLKTYRRLRANIKSRFARRIVRSSGTGKTQP